MAVTREASLGRNPEVPREESFVALVRTDYLVTSSVFRILFEIFLAISLIIPTTNRQWAFLVVTGTSTIIFLGLSLWFSRRARSSGAVLTKQIEKRSIGRINLRELIIQANMLSEHEANIIENSQKNFALTATPEEWKNAFLEWVHTERPAHPPLSDEAISRESIYREREDAQL